MNNIAARMILAYLNTDDIGEHFAEGPGNNAAWDTVAAQVGPCMHCWICIAQHLTLFAADEMTENMGHANALGYIQTLIGESLDFAERHEHDVGDARPWQGRASSAPPLCW
jgi:hypothetical protein